MLLILDLTLGFLQNRELAIMRTLNHQNVVRLKEFFYKIDDLSEDDIYLNLVLEYIPDTIFNISQKYLKHKRLIPPLHIKVSSFLIPFLVYQVCSIALYIPTSSCAGIYSFYGYLPSRYQTTEFIIRSSIWGGQIM